MILAIILAAAVGVSSSAAQHGALTCLIRETDRLANDPKQAAELRRWTRWEATRLLWWLAGDAPQCAGVFKQVRVTDETSNVAYKRADRLVVTKHLHRD